MRSSNDAFVLKYPVISTSTHLNVFHVGNDLGNVKESGPSNFMA